MEIKNNNCPCIIINLMLLLVSFFIFVAIFYIQTSKKEEIIVIQKEFIPVELEKITIVKNDSKEKIYLELNNMFNKELESWGAKIDRETLSIRFNSGINSFDLGKFIVKKEFEKILLDFFPKYINILSKYKDEIEEIKIEGYTNSGWNKDSNSFESYLKNMRLSQERTFSVFFYCINLPEIAKIDWVKKLISTNGFASNKLIYNANGFEDLDASRRVEFRIILKEKELEVDIVKKDYNPKDINANQEVMKDFKSNDNLVIQEIIENYEKDTVVFSENITPKQLEDLEETSIPKILLTNLNKNI